MVCCVYVYVCMYEGVYINKWKCMCVYIQKLAVKLKSSRFGELKKLTYLNCFWFNEQKGQ